MTIHDYITSIPHFLSDRFISRYNMFQKLIISFSYSVVFSYTISIIFFDYGTNVFTLASISIFFVLLYLLIRYMFTSSYFSKEPMPSPPFIGDIFFKRAGMPDYKEFDEYTIFRATFSNIQIFAYYRFMELSYIILAIRYIFKVFRYLITYIPNLF